MTILLKTKIIVTVMPSCGFLVLKAESQGSPFPILKCCVGSFWALFKINCLDIFKLSFVMISKTSEDLHLLFHSRLWDPGSNIISEWYIAQYWKQCKITPGSVAFIFFIGEMFVFSYIYH